MGTPPLLCCGYALSTERRQQDKDNDPRPACQAQRDGLWLYVCFVISHVLTAPCFLHVRVKFRSWQSGVFVAVPYFIGLRCFRWLLSRDFISCFIVIGSFAELRKSLLASSCLSVRPSIRPHVKHLCSYWKNFHEIEYFNIFRKSVEKIQVSINFYNKDEYFTWRPTYIYVNRSLNSL